MGRSGGVRCSAQERRKTGRAKGEGKTTPRFSSPAGSRGEEVERREEGWSREGRRREVSGRGERTKHCRRVDERILYPVVQHPILSNRLVQHPRDIFLKYELLYSDELVMFTQLNIRIKVYSRPSYTDSIWFIQLNTPLMRDTSTI